MSVVLITGATGFVGSRLVASLSREHTVIALSRRASAGASVSVIGDFTSLDDLHKLDPYQIDSVVHLAAETGGTSEEAGLAVNVQGTARLIRHLADRGVKRFVLASSIAVTGCLSPEFVPSELPIPDDYPCEATDAYGLSKSLMEQLAEYFQRALPDLDIDLFRLGAVVPEGTRPTTDAQLDAVTIPFCIFGSVSISDVVTVLTRAAATTPGPGVRRMNVVSAEAATTLPIADALERVLGPATAELDLSAYRQPGAEHAGLYSLARLEEVYGWVPTVDVSR